MSNSSQKFHSAKKVRTRENIVSSLKESIIASHKFEYFSKKDHIYLKTPPKLAYIDKLLNFSNSGSPSITHSSNEKHSPAFSFSNLSRFDQNILEKFKSIN